MLQISTQDQETLETWVRATTTEQRLVTRARIILALAQGGTNKQVAKHLEPARGHRQQVARALRTRGTGRAFRRAALRQAADLHA